MIGAVNYIGPRHTGTFALFIAIAAIAVFLGLAVTSIPFLQEGWRHVLPPEGDSITLWVQFCSVIVALSGIETIANTTSTMKLNPGSTLESPQVTKTSTPAIFMVMIEVVILTSLFGLAASATGNFVSTGQGLSAPGFPI